MNYIANRYKNEATKYSGVVTNVNGNLELALDEVNHVNDILTLNKNNSNDLLTYNVISGNEEIRSELKEIVSNLTNINSLIKGKAIELDNDERRKYEAYLKTLDENEVGKPVNEV